MSKWPNYYCTEKTLDIELPWGGLTARIWFEVTDNAWSDEQLVQLAQSVRRNESWRNQRPSDLLDWLADLPGVNAVQVYRAGPGYKAGVMAYLKTFDEAENFQVSFSDEEMDRLTEEVASRMTGIAKHNLVLPGRQD